MKRWTGFLLCMTLLLSLTACGGADTVDERLITRPPEADCGSVSLRRASETPEPPAAQTLPEEAAEAARAPAAPGTVVGSYRFLCGGVELVPGAAFDPAALPAAQSVYQVPSCAIEGTDNLYNYGSFELTAFDDGTGEQIYSILLTDPNITTTEGLALGDSVEKMKSIYGDGYASQGNACVYTGSGELLYIILQGQTVASIEYRMITA